MKKSITFFAVVLVSAYAALTACSKGAAVKEDNSLKVGYSGNLCEVPVHISFEKGYYKEEGLDVELIKIAPGTTFDAITTGQIDAGFSLMASMIQPLANGLPAKITTGLHTGCDIVLVKPNSGITKAGDFKGKKIGVPSMTSSPVVYAKRVLADNGLNIRMENSDVEFAVYSQADLPLVLSNGTVDAIALNEPAATIAAKEYGLQTLFDSAVDKPYCDQYCCVAIVSDRLLKRDRRLAVMYTRAMQRASAYVQGNQEEIVRIVSEKKYVAGDTLVNAGVLKKFNYIPSVKGAYDAFGITAPQLQAIGMLSADISAEALQKNSVVFLEGLDDKYK